MDSVFEIRVKTAANAAWRAILVGVIVLTLQWIAYLIITSTHPAWLLFLWGRDATWPFVQFVWFCSTAVFKLALGVLALGALWLTLWARQLRKQVARQ
jgi:hypothetical protein